MESLSLQADKGQYDYRPQHKIDATEDKWQFEDMKPLTNSSTPLQFRIDDWPFPFCLCEMELHLQVKLVVAAFTAPAYHSNTSRVVSRFLIRRFHPKSRWLFPFYFSNITLRTDLLTFGVTSTYSK